ncbi:hypothetical protein KBD18_00930 [Patescibacteria group bacterium]|nr:hypothetical protein [Patescibacteria group bacterium]
MAAVFVNGYGATKDSRDRNYQAYLSAVRTFIWNKAGDGPHTLFLCGGHTNRDDLTEAETMRRWFEAHPLPRGVKVVLIDDTVDARNNICRMEKRLRPEQSVVIFCEYSRRRTMRFFAGRLFRHFEVRGIPFDQHSLRLEHRVMQALFHLPLEVLAWYVQPADDVRNWLRARHIRRARSVERNV